MFVPALLTCIVLRAFSAQAKVADDFDCKEFFYEDTEPVGMDQNAKKICQFTANLGPHYATLYSVNHKIPLYSAYRFDPTCFSDSGRPSFWHLEPQISKPEEQTQYYMVRENQNYKRAYKGEQAISDDYSETGYDKGHLNPNSFQCGVGRIATSTLTNAAPMDACFNRNQWGKWEKTLRTFLRDKLISDSGSAAVYIVTGTVPEVNLRIPQSEISEEPERVTVPSHIWTAVCYNVPNLNTQIKNHYRQRSEISIFVDDCFHDNNKLDDVQVKFQTLISQQSKEKQGVQMSSDMQNTCTLLKRAADSNIIPEKKFKVSEMTIKLAIDSMSTYYNEAKNLKVSAGSSCLITRVKPLKRRVSDAVECLLVPEKQKTAADGSPCSSFSDSRYSCQCETNGEVKSCCSTPSLYQDNLNSYRCYSGQTQIECSARYSLVTFKGEKCLDDHPCATYGNDYYWCKTISGSWDFCSPPLWRSKAKNGKYCRSDHACAKYGSRHMWCYTNDEGNYDDCCTSDDCYSAVDGQTCRSNHKCGYHEKDYLWCYTDYEDNWDYCCKSCW
uniref:Si:ch211-165i18.2 n=1 Tax=Sinocyclocheilus anshuiensis TaxID=1608454 RepID=A0A671SGJ3_9TELE